MLICVPPPQTRQCFQSQRLGEGVGERHFGHLHFRRGLLVRLPESGGRATLPSPCSSSTAQLNLVGVFANTKMDARDPERTIFGVVVHNREWNKGHQQCFQLLRRQWSEQEVDLVLHLTPEPTSPPLQAGIAPSLSRASKSCERPRSRCQCSSWSFGGMIQSRCRVQQGAQPSDLTATVVLAGSVDEVPQVQPTGQ